MVDPISMISLIALAAQSVLTLTDLIKDYRGLDDTLQGLVGGLEALQEAIQALEKPAALDEENFRKLSRLLSACTKRCDDLTQLIQQCSAHPRKNRQSIRDWLTYRFTVNDISEFRGQIDDFKTTILIHMSAIAIKKNEANEEQVQRHHQMIAATLPRLEKRLDDVTDMLQNPSRATGQRSGDERDKWSRLAEERADTINCIAICKTARQDITRRYLPAHQHWTELGDRLVSLEMQRKRQEQAREVLAAQVRVISAAQNRWDLRNISAGEYTSQSMVSNSGAGFSADNVRAGNGTMQAFGTIDAASLQQLSANHAANMHMHMLAVRENKTNHVPEERWDESSVNTAVCTVKTTTLVVTPRREGLVREECREEFASGGLRLVHEGPQFSF
ncbi:Pc19g00310 [Penicillium rubens Wisconsin 54-1255]|uniref:Pc19g00310 protein n=1 Tax=Penicillium rubens (strain ATCC 28089 / DSM 1075 / NRRL 1951 / Wisconsin 54-1255) TaxID=500485 RepID=B6HD24_PENRW|nr:Pc19g00310 [Penicillium rubens Wisconsin 54-1255]